MACDSFSLDQENKTFSWDRFWRGATPESEISMWDFYGGRPWVLKHTPRYGKVVEAGCGLGRYVFYLNSLGIDIHGLDFHQPAVERVSTWGKSNMFSADFLVGNVLYLPYQNNSLSGYLSFGVIEHFQQGPRQALSEVYRVLRPGGIAIISTPSPTISWFLRRLYHSIRNYLKTFARKHVSQKPFSQYWYSPAQLRSFIQEAGLKVQMVDAIDVKYMFWELGARPEGRRLAFRMADWLEGRFVVALGAQAFTISVKVAEKMYCYLCGKLNVVVKDLKSHYLPICSECSFSNTAAYYQYRIRPSFHVSCDYQPPTRAMEDRFCYFCHEKTSSNEIFEDYGFSVPVCKECLKDPCINLELSNKHILPRWRPR